jgi:hypothetical protein
VYVGRVVYGLWETVVDVRLVGVWKTVVTLVSRVELVSPFDW